MDSNTIFLLFISLLLLSAMPSASVLMVVSRSVSSGFVHGVSTSVGIVTGDIIFIVVALLGLSFVEATLGEWFLLIRYLAAFYLCWFGYRLYKKDRTDSTKKYAKSESLVDSFFGGLLLTLADQKAIFFYLGFFPAFIDLSLISAVDLVIIFTTTIVAVGGVKVFYALIGSQSKILLENRFIEKALYKLAGVAMILSAIFLLLYSY